MLGAGTLTARVVGELPLPETAEAHRRLESGTVRGRIVVRP
jgi:NADPH:quinone reductase-like Zn-dependent oxidoreductase